MAGLVGVWKVAGIPGWCADRRDIRSGKQEAAWGRLFGLQLSRDRGLSICFHQTLDVPRVPGRRWFLSDADCLYNLQMQAGQ